MDTRLSIPIVSFPTQAVLQVQQAIAGAFPINPPGLEFVRDDAGNLTELQVVFSSTTHANGIAELRRQLAYLGSRVDSNLIPPLGSGGAVKQTVAIDFDSQTAGAPPEGLSVEGAAEVVTKEVTSQITTELGVAPTPAPYDLSTTALGGVVEPETLFITVKTTSGEETISDDGAGALVGTNDVLPDGGTIDYTTGEMTGITAAVTTIDGSVVAEFTRLTTAGPALLYTQELTSSVNLGGLPALPGVEPTKWIQAGSVSITATLAGGTPTIITDNGNGSISGDGMLSAGTISYATGELDGVIHDVEAGSEITVTYTFEERPTITLVEDTSGWVDLAETPLTLPVGAGPIVPGSIAITVVLGEAEQTISDDGEGTLAAPIESGMAVFTSDLGPGLIDYDTGNMVGKIGTLTGLDAGSPITATYDVEFVDGLATTMASGGAAGSARFSTALTKAVGAVPESFKWGFTTKFPTDFAVNNNEVTEGQSVTFNARLVGLLRGDGDVTIQWSLTTVDEGGEDDVPEAWGTPVFTAVGPTESPSADLAIPLDGAWRVVAFERVSSKVLRVTVGEHTQDFTFPQEIVVPRAVVLATTWGAALDRSLEVDDWSVDFQLPIPAL